MQRQNIAVLNLGTNELEYMDAPILEGYRELAQEEVFLILAEKEKQLAIKDLIVQIEELDKKRVRAIAEPELKDGETGETWLEHYTVQIQELRAQISAL